MVIAADLEGRHIGPYVVGVALGRGGMGAVYAARDTLLARDVAIKLVGDGGSDAARRRVLREARAAARLRHPGLVQLHGVHDDGERLLIVMERVDGDSVATRLRDDGPLPWREALRVAADAAAALAAAHAGGVIHRDVKPGNIIIDGSGAVRVVDFGLAVIDDVSSMSREAGAGTPAYMSPEQCRADPVTPRSDVYALGATLFHMLTGRAPFVGDTAVQVMFAHCSRDVPDPRGLRPDLPAACAEIVRRATARSPSARYPGAVELEAALRAALASEAADPQVPGRRAPWRLGLAAATAAAIGLGSWPTPADDRPVASDGRGERILGLTLARLPLPGRGAAAVASPDGRLLAVGGPEDDAGRPWLRMWEVVEGELRAVPAPAPDRPVAALALSRSGRRLAVAGDGGVAVASWAPVGAWRELDDEAACALALDVDGSRAWGATPSGALLAWDADGGRSGVADGAACAVALLSPGAAVAGLRGGLRWDDGSVAPVGDVRAVAPAAGGSFVAVAGAAGARVLGARGGARVLSADPSYALVAYAPDAARVAAAGERLSIWRLPAADLVADLPLDVTPAGLAWVGSGLALVTADGELWLWGVTGG